MGETPSLDGMLETGGRLRWGYDPEADGALCSRCSLFGRVVVPSEMRAGALLTIAAEAPGRTEDALGYPLAGPSGTETMAAIHEAGLRREDVSLCNAMCCRAPEESYDVHLRLLKTRNKSRKARGIPELLAPHVACRPRLLKEIKGARALVLIGAIARKVVKGANDEEVKLRGVARKARVAEDDAGAARLSIGEFGEEIDEDSQEAHDKKLRIAGRGFPSSVLIEGREIPCLTTFHPAFVIRKRRWTKTFRDDVKKAVRMSRGQLQWIEPSMIFFPTNEQLANYLDGLPRSAIVSYDIETNGIEPTEAKVRCIGIGTKDSCICVPFRTVESAPSWHYSRAEREVRNRILLDWFGDPRGSVVAQNEKFDRGVLENSGDLPGFVMRRKVFDTAVAHHVAWSEWAHDLDFLIAQYTDAPQHKAVNHDAWRSDHELHEYCMLDNARQAEVAEKLLQEPALRAQAEAFRQDMFLSSTFCRKMGEIGFKLDIAERDRLYQVQTDIMDQKREEARELAAHVLTLSGHATPAALKLAQTLNPNSYKQVGALLYEAIGVEPAPDKAGGYTETGDPSTKEDILYYLMDRGLPDVVERMLLAIIDYRGASKLRGTYCTVQPRWDGRVRPTWNAHVVVSGRLSCSKPNLMNLERSIRSMYICEPGHVIIACDKAQLEARVIAWLSQDTRWIEAFLSGADIHKVNAVDLLDIPKIELVTKAIRQFTKTFVYAIQYGAGVKKAYQMIRSFVDHTGKRPYRKRTLSEIALCYRRFWAQHTAITRFHEKNREKQRLVGYHESAIHGRRRYFLDGQGDEDTKEEEANFDIQSCLRGSVYVLTRQGYLRVDSAPRKGEVWTGTKWAAYTRVDRGANDLGELRLSNGVRLECDTNHQVLVAGEDDYRFKHWADLALGDRVCLSLARELEYGDPHLVDTGTAYWMGFAIGNGSTAFNERLPRKYQQESWEWLGYPWGATAHNRTVPSVIWKAALPQRRQFLLGILDADGYADPAVGSRALLAQVQMLARTVGVESKLHGPYQDGASWRLDFNKSQLASLLGYGWTKRRAKTFDMVPRFVVEEFLGLLKNSMAPHRTSAATLLYRMRHGGSASVYMLPELAKELGVPCPEVYATSELVEKRLTGEREPVYTLSVDDPGHRFDSGGVISKNTAADDVNDATERVVEEFPWGYAGPYTGVIHQCHDALALETTASRAMIDGPRMVELMFSKLGDMPLPVDLAIGPNYGKKTEYVQTPDGTWVPKG